MKLKVFEVRDGKLIFIGTREPQKGDSILKGLTGMNEVSRGVIAASSNNEIINLKESKHRDINAEILEGLSGQEKEDFLAGLKALNMANPEDKATLRESVKRLHPEWTKAQVDVFMENLEQSPILNDKEALRESFKKQHPEWTDAQLDAAVEGR
jgi:hypothetical protein